MVALATIPTPTTTAAQNSEYLQIRGVNACPLSAYERFESCVSPSVVLASSTHAAIPPETSVRLLGAVRLEMGSVALSPPDSRRFLDSGPARIPSGPRSPVWRLGGGTGHGHPVGRRRPSRGAAHSSGSRAYDLRCQLSVPLPVLGSPAHNVRRRVAGSGGERRALEGGVTTAGPGHGYGYGQVHVHDHDPVPLLRGVLLRGLPEAGPGVTDLGCRCSRRLVGDVGIDSDP